MAGAGPAGDGGELDGAWLRRLRTSAGLTQAQLAEQAAVGVRTVRELERRGVRPRASSLHRLAAALGIDAAQLDGIAYGVPETRRAADAVDDAEPEQPAGPVLCVDVLGPLCVRRGARTVAVASAMHRTLLGLLAVQPGRIAGIEEIIDTLWDGTPPRTCRELVHTYVSNLRRLLPSPDGGSLLRREQAGYRLRLETAGSDAARFTDLAARARRAADSGAAQSAWQLHGEALACWRGPLLDGGGAWRERHPTAIALAAQRIAVAVEWAEIGLGLGCYARTAQVLHALCAQEPLHEGLAARLMIAWAGEGRQAEALALFSALSQRLDAELGVRPGPELREAQLRVLRGRLPAAAKLVGVTGIAGVTGVTGGTGAVGGTGVTGNAGVVEAAGGASAADVEADSAGDAGVEPAEPPGPSDPSRSPAVSALPAVPAQLPADAGGFAGREAELRALDRLLEPADGGAAPILVLSGMAGVGKTTLAVRWARSVRERFPDGQLYADLRGHVAHGAAAPLEVLAAFLGAFGVSPGAVPADADQAAALLRSLTERRRILVLLDNAADAAQVRPLLPGSAGSVTLVLSRTRLSGLIVREGAAVLAVEPLAEAESVQLLARAVGDARTRAEAAAVAEIAELCAHLPLALRITAANLAVRPTHRIAEHAARLRAAGGRLDALAVEGDPEIAVRAAFGLSCAALAPADLRAFQLLGLVPGPDVTAGQAAALLGSDAADARASLDRLADRSLLSEYRPGRYRLHDLVRLYARELAHQEQSEWAREEAMRRLTAYCLAGVARAAQLLYPHLLRVPGAEDAMAEGCVGPLLQDARVALAWLDEERPGLLALLAHLAESGAAQSAFELGHTLNGYCFLRADTTHWPMIARISLQAAAMAGGGEQLAMAWLQCGMATRAAADYEAAVGHFTRSIRAARRAGWNACEAVALNNLATVMWARGDAAETIRLLDEALGLHRRSGRKAGEAVTLANLGAAHLEAAREAAPDVRREHLLDALRLLNQARDAHREAGDGRNEGDTVRMLATVYRELGEVARALELAREALHLGIASGDLLYEASARSTLATLLARTGPPRRALEEHEHACRIAHSADAARFTAAALIDLAETHLLLGQLEEASLAAADAQALAVRARYVPLARRAGYVRSRVAGRVGGDSAAVPPVSAGTGL